jgi:hypothetical protein
MKRPAPSPPVTLRCVGYKYTSSTPDIPGLHESHSSRMDLHSSRPPRYRLRKSLSMSGSRGFFATMLATLRGSGSRYRLNGAPSPLHKRRSRSHDYLDLAPLDQEQRMVNDAARSAQMRRGTVCGDSSPIGRFSFKLVSTNDYFLF